jgi:hypothetical protein
MPCEVCGGSPAGPVLLQSASSRIIWWNHRKIDANLCGYCAERVFFDQQSRTLIQGWWGPLSALATVWFSIANFVRITEHRKFISTVEIDGLQVPRPRLKASGNPVAMVVSAVAVLIIVSLAVSVLNAPTPVSDTNPTSFNSTCWEDTGENNLRQVSCDSDSAKYETYQVVSDPSLCANLYLTAGTQYACLQEKFG